MQLFCYVHMTLFVGWCSSSRMPRFVETLLYILFDFAHDFKIHFASNRNECYMGTVIIYDRGGGYSIVLRTIF